MGKRSVSLSYFFGWKEQARLVWIPSEKYEEQA